MVEKHVIAINAGGILAYVYKFFPERGVHELNERNKQYTDLLQLFQSVDKLFKMLQQCLDQLKENNTSFDPVFNEDIGTLQTCKDTMKVEFENVRDERYLDELIADERDNFDIEDDDW